MVEQRVRFDQGVRIVPGVVRLEQLEVLGNEKMNAHCEMAVGHERDI